MSDDAEIIKAAKGFKVIMEDAQKGGMNPQQFAALILAILLDQCAPCKTCFLTACVSTTRHNPEKPLFCPPEPEGKAPTHQCSTTQ